MGEVLPMPDVRRQRLKELEEVIASGWTEFVRVGYALREIRDEGYFDEVGAPTFEIYCKTRWSMHRTRGYQYIDAADIHDAVSTIGRQSAPILVERVARELAPVLHHGGPAKVAEVWRKVSERFEGQRAPTAREVHRVLIEEGYRQSSIGPSSGKVNRRILLGQYGDKLIAARKRLRWFITNDLGSEPPTKSMTELAGRYAGQCEQMARVLRALEANVPIAAEDIQDLGQ